MLKTLQCELTPIMQFKHYLTTFPFRPQCYLRIFISDRKFARMNLIRIPDILLFTSKVLKVGFSFINNMFLYVLTLILTQPNASCLAGSSHTLILAA